MKVSWDREVTWIQLDSVSRCNWQLCKHRAHVNWIYGWTNKGKPNSLPQKGTLHLHLPLISQIPAHLLSVQIIAFPSTFLPLTLSLIATVNKECAGFPQALKESLTLHSHNHFRPGCLGRHVHWDLPAARCRQNQTTEWKQKKSTATVKQRSASQTKEHDQSEDIKHSSSSGWMSYSPPL